MAILGVQKMGPLRKFHCVPEEYRWHAIALRNSFVCYQHDTMNETVHSNIAHLMEQVTVLSNLIRIFGGTIMLVVYDSDDNVGHSVRMARSS